MGLLLQIHGDIRWFVVIIAAVVVVKFLVGWLGKKEYGALDKRLLTLYTVVLDINVLLGLVLLLFSRGALGPRMEHATMMVLAAVVAHLTAIWRKSTDSPTKFRNQLLMVLLSLVLVAVGVIRLRGGFVF